MIQIRYQNTHHFWFDLYSIAIIGDSMHPTLNHGMLILFDKSSVEVDQGNIYVISTLNGTFVKRLFMQDNTLILSSDNPHFYIELYCSD